MRVNGNCLLVGIVLLLSAFLPANAQSLGTNGLIAHYPLNGNALDVSGNEVHGLSTGAVPTTNRFGQTNSALLFNGVSDLINCGNPSAFNFASDFTVVSWVKLNGAQFSKYMVAKYAGSGNPRSWGLGLEAPQGSYGYVFASGAGPGWQEVFGGPLLNDGKWHALAYTYENTFGLRLYVDGALAISLSAPGLAPFTNSQPVTIGGLASGLYFAGAMDEVRLFNGALSASEVKAQYDFPPDQPIDNNPPSVTLTSPSPGAVSGRVYITGTITDNFSVRSNRWELNGVSMGALTLSSSGAFDMTSPQLAVGENRIRVVAFDASGNIGQAEVTVSYTPPITGPKGLIASYGLDANGLDSSSNHFDATLVGVTPATNRYNEANSALSFNGVSSYVDCGNPTAFNFETNFTISALVKLNGNQGKKYFISKYRDGDGISAPPHAWGFGFVEGSSRLYGFITGAGPGFLSCTGGPDLNDGKWHAVSFVYDNNFGIRLYADGIQVATRSALGYAPFINSGSLTIGGEDPGQYFGGSIDSTRIFNRALSAAEIQEEFNFPPDQPADTIAPVVTITAPVAGAVGGRVILSGTITDNFGVRSNRWELNGGLIGSLTLSSSGAFSVASPALTNGQNQIRVIAYDASGNAGQAEVIVSYTPPLVGTNGLIAEYRLNANGLDSSSNHFDATLVGVTPATNRYSEANSALSFNGVSSVVDCGNPPAFNFENSFTIGAWIKLNGNQSKKYFISKYRDGNGVSAPPHSFGMGFVDGASRVYGFVSGAGPGFVSCTGGPDLNDGKWHATTFVYDNNFGIRLYVDGVLVASQAAIGYAPFVNPGSLAIGGEDPQQYFGGLIDSARIFNRALSASEIQNEFVSPPDRPDDTTPPVVTITSPGPGLVGSRVILNGTISDIFGVRSNRWELNGISMGSMPLTSGVFTVTTPTLPGGESRIRVMAWDEAGNMGQSEVLVSAPYADSTGLIAYYRFNGDGQDATSNRFDATVQGAVATLDRFGEPNSALAFNGVSNYVNAGDRPAFNFVGDFTIAAWVRLNGNQALKYLFAKYSGGDGISVPPHSFGVGLEDGTSRLYAFAAANGPGFFWAAGGPSLADGAWHNVVFVYDNNFGIRLYVDGAQVGSRQAPGLSPFFHAAPLTIGGLTTQQFFGGAIDSVRIFNRARTASEILGEFNFPPDRPADTAPPVVTITSPTPGPASAQVNLTGTITDNIGVTSARWELNGAAMGALNTSSFSVSRIDLTLGENRLKVFARDAAGNEGSSAVIVDYTLPDPTNGLVGHYPLDGNAVDASGNGRHGVIFGAQPTGGRFGGTSSALSFNGAGNYVNCGNPSAYNFSNDFSITVWAKLNGSQPATYIVAKYPQEGAPFSFGLGTQAVPDSGAYAFVSGASPGWIECLGGPRLNDGNWHALAFTYERGVRMRLYVDGALVGTTPIPTLPAFFSNQPLTIGGLVTNQFFGGAIDDVRLYNRALGAAEVQANYIDGSTPPLVGVKTDLFDVQQGTVLTRSSGLQSSESDPGMLGGADEPRSPAATTFADDKPNSFTHFTEWRTAQPVTLNHIKLYAEGDGALYNNGREFARFTLKAKSQGSTNFDRTIVTFEPSHPYTFLSDRLILDTNFTAVTAQEFRGEFEQINLREAGWNAPRVIELDAFGPPPSPIPAIFQQPSPVNVLAGGTARFEVSVTGANPLTYQWMRDQTNLTLSSRVQSPDGKTLIITNVSAADVGSYSVLITNAAGAVQSAGAQLSLIADTNAPMVVITSPTSGSSGLSSVNIEGTAVDNFGVVAAHWERNGIRMGAVAVEKGAFQIPAAQLLPGANSLKVVARDSTGNEGFAEVLIVLSPTAQSNEDLWDVARGVIMTGSSGIFAEMNGPGLFGGGGYPGEPGGSTLFADDKTNGFNHFIEWRTPNGVTVSTIRLFAAGDGPALANGREFARFTLKAKSPGSTNYDVTVLSYVPPAHPYGALDPQSALILETNIPPFTAQEFRAEFEQSDLRTFNNGPRITELDAFGPSSAGGPPQIVFQPQSRESFSAASASFLVGVTGATPLVYQWRHAGTNLSESSKFVGVKSWSLTVNNLTAADAGAYSVLVTNAQGQATSLDAQLTVSLDTNAPIVTITSPTAGAQANGTFTLQGSVVEANAISSVRLEINERAPQQLTLANGTFRVTGLNLDFGTNRIKVIAIDIAGNEGIAEVTAVWMVPRAIVLSTPPATQDGANLSVPVILVSTGGVSGATFTVDFDTNYLANASLEWRGSASNAFNSVNLEGGKRFRATFILAGTTISAGPIPIATLRFRARSVPETLQTPLTVGLAGIYSETGDAFEANNSAVSTLARITKRRIIGDNNANDLLDVGDASSILRLVTGFDPIRSWDRTLNDLTRNGNVDGGDAIRVLRAVVELDPQPNIPASVASVSALSFQPAKLKIPALALLADRTVAAPGDKVTVEIRLADQATLASGLSFRLAYPPGALAIDSAAAQTLGSIVPSGAASAWNVAPGNSYTTQDGWVSLALSSPTLWPSSNGVVARIAFTAQSGITNQAVWPLQLENVVIAREGGIVESAVGGSLALLRAPQPPRFSSGINFINRVPQLSVQGDMGASYIVEATSDFQTWSQVGIANTANGSATIVDTNGLGATQRFYRAVVNP